MKSAEYWESQISNYISYKEFIEHIQRDAYNSGLSTAIKLEKEGRNDETLICGLESSKIYMLFDKELK